MHHECDGSKVLTPVSAPSTFLMLNLGNMFIKITDVLLKCLQFVRSCTYFENTTENTTPKSDDKGLAYKGFFKPSTEAL